MSTEVTFSDRYRVGLPAGSYRFVLGQSVTVGSEGEHYYRDQRFEIVAPRFALDAGELQTTFPPPGGTGDYQRVLPHAVLRTRTLPWEREPWTGENPAPPWLALIVLSEAETAAATSRAGTVGELSPDPPGGSTRTEQGRTVLVPAVDPPADDAAPVRLLDLDAATFRAIRPGLADVPLLAHVRSVDTVDKAPAGLPVQDDTAPAPAGDFAVVVANRFPPPGTCTAHLISLDGGRHLLDGPLDDAGRVRLVSLHSWTFANAEGIDTFGELASGLAVEGFGVAGFGVAGEPGPTDDPDEAAVEQALAEGYVPLEYRPLASTATFAWYRGPFAPRPRTRVNRGAFTSADAALVLHERTGVFDVSYAAAWELGRLLALASPAFAGGLRTFVDATHDAADLAESVRTFLDLHRSALPSGAPGATTVVPASVTLAQDLATWLARLVLLYPVPLSYLVPHAALLPAESLRFFHLDDTWVDALLDGALAAGVRTPGDQAVVARTGLRATVDDLVRGYRSGLLGTPPPDHSDEPVTGLLLRSKLIPGWPGLEVRVAAGDGTLDPTRLLRMDRIADDVLLVLVRGVVTRLVLREPAEGLRFGVDTAGRAGAGPPVQVIPDLVRDGVLRVAELRDGLRAAGPAGLARQMARRPEEQPFTWL